MNAPSPERLALENAARDLMRQGYDVIQAPPADVVPAFLEEFQPDLIAFKEGGPNLVVEIKRRGKAASRDLSDIRKRFEGHPDWRFSVIWVDLLEENNIDISSAQAIFARAEEATSLTKAGFYGSALLICWALLESVARSYFSSRLNRPQAPKSVVQILESEGLIEAEEARQLRRLAESRNRLIHGLVEEQVGEQEVRDFLVIIQRLIRDLATSSRGSPT
jgi:uncharacterized protein YutE (UPF0331/DUF86 family)